MNILKNVKKFISLFLVIQTLLFSAFAFAETDIDSECMDGKTYASMENNFTKITDFKKPCVYLQLQDEQFLFLMETFATKELLKEEQEYLENLGLDFENAIEFVPENSTVSSFLELSSKVVFWMALGLSGMTIFLVMVSEKKTSNNIVALMISVILSIFVVIVVDNRVKISAFLVSNMNQMFINWQNPEAELEELSRKSTKEFNNSYSAQDVELLNAFLQVEIKNVMTDVETWKRNYGSTLEIEVPALSTAFSNSKPTIAEYKDYQVACSQLTNHLDVDTNFEFSFSFDFDRVVSSIPSKATWMIGGDTNRYECVPDYFGKETDRMTVKSNLPNVAQNFFEKNYKSVMSNDTTMTEDFKSLFNSRLGYFNDRVERTSEIASQNAKSVLVDVEKALAAIKTADKNGVEVRETEEYKELVTSNKKKQKEIHIYDSEEGFSPNELRAFNGMMVPAYKFALLAGYSDEEDSITGHLIYGYNHLRPFLVDTVFQNFDAICGSRFSNSYELRTKHANLLNKLTDSARNRDSRPLFSGYEKICFSGYEKERQVIALGDPQLNKDSQLAVSQRIRALSLWLESISQASYELTTDSEEVFEKLKLEYVNSIRPTFEGVINGAISGTDLKNEHYRVFDSVNAVFTIDVKDTSNLSVPQTFFSYDRFSDKQLTQKDYSAIDENFKMSNYNFSDFLLTGSLKKSDYNSSRTEAPSTVEEVYEILGYKDELDDFLSVMSCPVITDTGKCRASILEMNKEALGSAVLFWGVSETVGASVSFASGVCATMDSGEDSEDYATGNGKKKAKSGKGNLLVMLGCGMVEFIDLTIGEKLETFNLLLMLTVIFMVLSSSMFYLVQVFIVVFLVNAFILPIIALGLSAIVDFITNIRNIVASGFDSNYEVKFSKTTEVFKNLILRIVVAPFGLYIYYLYLTSPTFGGVIYNILNVFQFGDNMIMQMVKQMLFCAIYALVIMLSLKWSKSAMDDVYRQIGGSGSVGLLDDATSSSDALTYFLSGTMFNQIGMRKSRISGELYNKGVGMYQRNRAKTESEAQRIKDLANEASKKKQDGDYGEE